MIFLIRTALLRCLVYLLTQYHAVIQAVAFRPVNPDPGKIPLDTSLQIRNVAPWTISNRGFLAAKQII